LSYGTVFKEIKMILDDAKLEYYLERKFYPRERSKEPTFIGEHHRAEKYREGGTICFYLCKLGRIINRVVRRQSQRGQLSN
jgi:hypothetical protein